MCRGREGVKCSSQKQQKSGAKKRRDNGGRLTCLNVLLPALVHHNRTDAVYPGQNMRGEVAGRTEPNFEPEKRGEKHGGVIPTNL